MILPDRYTNLHTCVLNVAATVLEAMLSSDQLSIPEVEALVQKTHGDAASYNLLPALSLLFCLGFARYDGESDMLVLDPGQNLT